MDYLKLKKENKELNYKEIKEKKLVLKSRPLFFWFDICGQCNLQVPALFVSHTGQEPQIKMFLMKFTIL